MRRRGSVAVVALFWSVFAVALCWSAAARAQSGVYEPRTMTTLDAQCIARAIDDCVANELGPRPPLPGQNLRTFDYHADEPCVEGISYGEDGQLLGACDYNPSLHRNTTRLTSCQARVHADPPPQCQSEVLTARGVEDLVREALRSQTAALREALFQQCRASATRPEQCDGLRPESQ